MSQENVESFKRFVKAWNHDDFDAWIDQLDSEEILLGQRRRRMSGPCPLTTSR
jgi:hypothetical protein